MKPLSLNLSKMKKVGGDENHSVFMHPSGHQIKVAHAPLSALQRKQIEKMPVHQYADGAASVDPTLDAPNSSSIYDSNDSVAPVTSQPDVPLAQKIGSGLKSALGYASDIGPLGAFKAAKAIASSDAAKDFYSGLVGDDQASSQSGQAGDPTPSAPTPQNDSVHTSQAVPVIAEQAKLFSPDQSSDFSNAYQQGLRSIQEQQKISSQQAEANAKDYQDDIQHQRDLIEDAKHNLGEYQMHAEQFMNDYAAGHIKPNAYLENMSVPGKISTAIGLILGGAGAHSTGGVNQAAQFLNQQIERNIDAQKSRQDQEKTLIGANRQLYGDEMLSQNQTRINMNDMLAHQTQLEGAKLGTPQAKANADSAAAQFKMQNIPLLQQNAIRSTVLKSLQSSGGQGVSAIDLAHAGFMNPEEASKEQASIDAQKSAIQQVKSLYSRLGQVQTIGNRSLNPIQSASDVDALNAELTNVVMGADVSKRLTPESAKLEVLPFHVNLKDSPQTVQHKMAGVLDLVKQHNSGLTPNMARYAPASLPKYDMSMPNSLEGKTASDAKGNRIIMQNGRWVPYGG